ncbi:MAG TPA: hypothetical protein VHG72_21705 [Polyangia bacterium]|nr:hypothetical protein [Polyangia bacterium]
MKRGGYLQRRTPLRAKTPLRSTKFRAPAPNGKSSGVPPHAGRLCGDEPGNPSGAGQRATAKLGRGTPLKRSWIKRKSPRRISRETPVEKAYKTVYLRNQPCDGLTSLPGHICSPGPIQQIHLRDRTGLGLKERNLSSIPGCRGLHDEYDSRSKGQGHFAGWSLEDKKAWMRGRIAVHNARFYASNAGMLEEAA